MLRMFWDVASDRLEIIDWRWKSAATRLDWEERKNASKSGEDVFDEEALTIGALSPTHGGRTL